MPVETVTTTARDIFFGNNRLTSLSFKHGGTAGTIYLRYKPARQNVVTSTDYEWSLSAGAAIGLSVFVDGDGIVGPFAAISTEAGGAPLEILPIYARGIKGT